MDDVDHNDYHDEWIAMDDLHSDGDVYNDGKGKWSTKKWLIQIAVFVLAILLVVALLL